ncbi:2-oxoacid:acceptor oxidoreductase family protein [Candidatus Bipolaricaulota bacterium]|nr:2-oxoacid:acceptor oxidoreductase family protein [Candidatus Bipolaricaulota bacterium]
MSDKQKNLQFCGFGGQGIVLSSVIFGTAAVQGAGLNAVQTQSFGSEARGGECQAELILSEDEIRSPLADEIDLLVAMSQPALETYLSRLKSGKYLVLDPGLVERPDREDIEIIEVRAREIAEEIGHEIVANMVMLGFLQQATGLFTKEDLLETIEGNVNEKFLEVDVKAAEQGIQLAKDTEGSLEV